MLEAPRDQRAEDAADDVAGEPRHPHAEALERRELGGVLDVQAERLEDLAHALVLGALEAFARVLLDIDRPDEVAFVVDDGQREQLRLREEVERLVERGVHRDRHDIARHHLVDPRVRRREQQRTDRHLPHQAVVVV